MVVVLLGFGIFTLTKTPVPDLIGLDAVAAEQSLEENGLSVITGEGEFSDEIPKDTVARQEPGPGARVSSDSVVEIFLSRGPAVAAPDITRMPVVQARATAKKLGLTTKETKEPSDSIPLGQVISQSPDSGELVEQGSPVQLLISSGPPTTTVTYVNDLSNEILRNDFNCSTMILVWRISYRSAVIANGDDKVLSTNSGWSESLGNGTYFPCNVETTFPNVPMNEDDYQIWYSAEEHRTNHGGTYTRSQMERARWDIVE